MDGISEITTMVEQQSKAQAEFQAAQSTRLKTLESEVFELAKKAGRPYPAADTVSPATTRESWIDVKTKKPVPILRADESLAALDTKSTVQPSLGRVLRGIVCGGAAHDAHELEAERKALNIFSDPSGGYTVNGGLSSMWIDLLRANMVLTRAGAMTLPMDSGSVTIARVTADPSVAWKNESAAITDASPTFGAVTLRARTCVCLVKMSLELAQDSANIEQILQSTLTNAMAAAIDAAGLNGSTTDAEAAPVGIYNLDGINALSTVGAPTDWTFVLDAVYELLADNVAMSDIGAMIAHPKVWRKMAGLKTGISSDNTTLVMPPEVARLPKLWTSAAPYTSGTTCSAILGKWDDLIFGIRKDINVRILNEAFMGSNLQVGVLCYGRVDFAATRPTSFCVLPGITV